MQMKTAGGLAALTDGLREADPDNPRGYFEYEPVKHFRQSSGWLEQARGKAVKIVSPLLPYLPPIACRVVLMDRNLDEVLASQRDMFGAPRRRAGRHAGPPSASTGSLRAPGPANQEPPP
jgi:hypothetical protein